jgi:alanine racemase
MTMDSTFDTTAVIDLAAYRRNIQAIRNYIGTNTGVIAVVKANAYGHGMIECGKTAIEAGAAMLAVAFAADGGELRRSGIDAPILIMAPESFSRIPLLIENDLTGTLTSAAMLAEIERVCSNMGRQCRVHVKIDTGMGRIGVVPREATELIIATTESKQVRLDGIFSHFSSAVDADDPFPRRQIEVFHGVIDDVERRSIDPGIVHMCNSAGLLHYPDARFDMVRPGIITYGLEAFPGSFEKLRVEPVMSLVSRITFIKDVPAGFRVSYGGTFVTSRPSRLATVPVGYSYGYRRNLSNLGRAIVNGVPVPVAGRICMDQTVFDVTEAGDVHVGDRITLIGRDGGVTVTAEEHASIEKTINYEIVTGIPCNVPRIMLPST